MAWIGFEFYNLITTLAPYKTESPDDKSEWNLFNDYLGPSAQALDNPRDLSSMPRHLQSDVVSLVQVIYSEKDN